MGTPQVYQPGEFGIFHNAVWIYVIWPGSGASAPVPSQGDTRGNYATVTRTGVGTFSVTTSDGYPEYIMMWGQVQIAAMTGQWQVNPGQPVQNANKTWTIPFTVANASTASDVPVAAGNQVTLAIFANRSTQNP